MPVLLRLAPLLAAVLLTAGCGGEPEPLVAQVEGVVAEAEMAGEAQDIDALMDLVSEDYTGPMGESRRDLENIARFTFARHQEIHLLTKIDEIDLLDSTNARAGVLVAMSGRPIAGPEALESFQGSLWRFDVLLRREDGEVRVAQAQWRRARPVDFF